MTRQARTSGVPSRLRSEKRVNRESHSQTGTCAVKRTNPNRAGHSASPPAPGIGTPIRAADAQARREFLRQSPWFPHQCEAVTSRQTFSPRARNCHAGENAPEISSFRERSPKPSGNFHVTFLGPEAVDAVPQWQQDASSITASMPIRAGSLTLKMTASVIRADGPGLRASGKVSFHRLQCGCAVEARRMMRAEASLGTGARTERACSLSAWRARGRRQRGRPCAAGAVARARSG